MRDKEKVYCPYCNAETEANFVHNGVGLEQVSPYHCYRCGSSQIGTTHQGTMSPKEERTGWYEPQDIWWDKPKF